MKKLIFSVILTGVAWFSLAIVTAVGCGSPDQLGKGGTSGGGTAGAPTIKLDGSIAGGSGQGGGGGTSSSSAPPTEDANCGNQTSSTTREPPDVMIVLDCSSSMAWSIAEDNCYCTQEDITFSNAGSGQLCANTTDCSSRWSAVQPAVVSTVSNSSDIQWGLKFFPTPNSPQQCTVSNTMEVPVAADSASAISSQVQSATLSLSTPTAAALKAATAYLQTLTDNRPKVILLATDGEPNCGGTRPSIQTDDLTGATAAAKAAYDAGFPVYVIGIGPNPGNLTKLANAGSDPNNPRDYFPATSADQLVQAFKDIKTLVASCTFSLTTKPQDPNNVAVYVDKNLIPKDNTNGWSFGPGNQTIVLNGDICQKITSGEATTVQLLFGCAGPPPPTIK
jgi:hypothetical protein